MRYFVHGRDYQMTFLVLPVRDVRDLRVERLLPPLEPKYLLARYEGTPICMP